MDNRQIAERLELIANLLDVLDENAFKVRAYRTAARTIEGLEVSVASLVREGRLREVQGVGEGISSKIEEMLHAGEVAYLAELKQNVPAGLLDLLKIPSCGPKKVRTLWHELGIVDLTSLKKACQEGRIRQLKGFGEKSEAKILEGIDLIARYEGSHRLDEAVRVAQSIGDYLRNCPEAPEVQIAGSTRRMRETVHDLDILVSSSKAAAMMEYAVHAPGVEGVLSRGETKASLRIASGFQVDIRVVGPAQFVPALVHFTGSKDHNVLLRGRAIKMGLKLNEYGIFSGDKVLDVASEEEYYEMLGLSFVPPEMREGVGEIELAENRQVPNLLDAGSIVGVFHVHSTWSDGTASILDMAQKARSMGLRYLGISDHSKAAAYAGGMTEARLEAQMREVDALNTKWSDFRILKGLECDILPDGTLDMDPGLLERLDFLIGSVHSRFEMTEEEMTKRVIKALNSKRLDILGHPTGRLLLHREGYKIDLERVLQEARRLGKVVELNANPHRLDLDAVHVRRARELGVKISIGPDAHTPQGLEDLRYGVGTARRGWLEGKDVVNTLSADDVLRYFHGS